MNKIIGSVVTGVVVLGVLIGGVICTTRIPAGYAGVVYSMNGGVQDDSLSQGWHIVAPTKKVIKYPVSTETMYLSKDKVEGSEGDDSFNITTKDGKLVNVDCELSYYFDIDTLGKVFTKWRGKSSEDIEKTYIRARIKEAANNITSQYSVMDVYGEKRPEINKKVTEELKNTLQENGIILENFNFTRIEPDTQTQKAIQEKVDAQQKLEQDKIEAQRQEVTNQKNIAIKESEAKAAKIEAEGHAERLRISAEAEAEAIRVKAQAQAEANKQLANSLTDKVIQHEQIEAWKEGGAQVPTVTGDSAPIISIPSK